MSLVSHTISLVLAITLLASATIYSATTVSVLRLKDQQTIDFGSMVEEAENTKFIFTGEIHNNPRHHAAQLELIKRLRAAGRPLAIGLEMFTVTSQGMLDHWISGKLSEEKFREIFSKDWSMPWEYYRDILIYARDNHIRLYGLNLPRALTSKVAMEGFAALSTEERMQLPPGISCSVSPLYMELLRKAYTDHGKSDRTFKHFCEAQVLWNRHMAIRMRAFQKSNPSHTMVVLAGIGHALKRGAPEALNLPPSSYRVILPEYAGITRYNLTAADADYLLLFDDN